MPRHLRLAREGKPEFLEALRTFRANRSVQGDRREEPVESGGERDLALERRTNVVADDAATSARERDLDLLGRVVAEEPLLRFAAERRELLPARGVETGSPEIVGDAVREREVHVVTAEQDVVADRDPFEPETLRAPPNGDGGEVGRSAADVDDEKMLAAAQLVAPPRA